MQSTKNLILLIAIAFSPTQAWPGCDVVDGKLKKPFDGKTLDHLLVEKKSLVALNKEFPTLNVIEKTFKGEVLTCSNCTEKHVVCSR